MKQTCDTIAFMLVTFRTDIYVNRSMRITQRHFVYCIQAYLFPIRKRSHNFSWYFLRLIGLLQTMIKAAPNGFYVTLNHAVAGNCQGFQLTCFHYNSRICVTCGFQWKCKPFFMRNSNFVAILSGHFSDSTMNCIANASGATSELRRR